MVRLLGGTNPITGQGFQMGNPGNPGSLEALNLLRSQSQDQKVIRFKELVKLGSTPNEAKKIVIEEFKLNRSPKAGTPVWMTRGKEELIAEGFDYKASARGPENVGGVEKAATKRKNVLGEGRKFEERIKRLKQKTGLGKSYELAHTANIFQAKKLGIDYPIDALAIQTQNINNKVAEQLNDELKPWYRKQLKLFNKMKRKNTPSLKKQMDKVNLRLMEIVATGGSQGDVAANVLKPIHVNADTLQPRIMDLGFDVSTEIRSSPGATTKAAVVGSADDALARGNVLQTIFNQAKPKEQFTIATTLKCVPGNADGGRIGYALGTGTVNCVQTKLATETEIPKLTQLDDSSPGLTKMKNAATGFLNFAKKGGKYGAIAAAGAATAGLVKTFMNDDPTTYLSNEDQQKNMLIDMVTSPMVDQPDSTPEILDWQLPALGATAAAGTAVTAPSTIEASRSARFGKKPSGYTKTALKTLGRGLATTGTPLGLAAFEPLHIAGQVQAGDSLGEIATNPWNYAGLAFADDLSKFATKGLGPNIAKAMRLGISPAALKVGSRFLGLPGLALSLGISGYETYDDWRNKRGWFSEE